MKPSQRKKEWKVYRKKRRRKIYLRNRNYINNRKKEKKYKKKSRLITLQPVQPKVLLLPENFSFINNPNEVMKTFAQFRSLAQDGIPVILEFRRVKKITPDIIPILLGKVYKYGRLTRLAGTRPSIRELDELLLESGFYKMVGLTKYKSQKGLLETHKNKIVDRELAVAARKLASEKTFKDPNRKIKPLYRTLIECMANTRKHASEKEDQQESWWLSVYYNQDTGNTCFSFCDNGVGIFKSTRLKPFAKFALKIGLNSNRDILMKMLEGKMESSTGLHYRGKGLPKIYNDHQKGSLKKLHIAANDTFADLENGIFVDLNNELNGTFLYWEIANN